MLPSARSILSLFLAALLLSPSSFAFQTPLSDEAVREAYFLGQRRDGSFPRFLDKYAKRLPPPKFGPYISSVTFITPFAQLAQFSDRYLNNTSAQQAELDHRGQRELVKILIQIQLTDSYGPFLNGPASPRRGSPQLLIPRPHDFWKDFHVEVFSKNEPLEPSTSGGEADYRCGRYGPCSLIGATLEWEFPVESFTSDFVTIQVTPPEGDQVSVDFDLVSFR